MSHANTENQPQPEPNEKPAVWSLVMRDMVDRDIFGAEKYRTRLQPCNGRDFLVDAYQEALDLVVYLRGAIYERDNTPTVKDSFAVEKPAFIAPDHWDVALNSFNADAKRMRDDYGQQNQLMGGAMIQCHDCTKEHCACLAR
jgi:hypothetical protein